MIFIHYCGFSLGQVGSRQASSATDDGVGLSHDRALAIAMQAAVPTLDQSKNSESVHSADIRLICLGRYRSVRNVYCGPRKPLLLAGGASLINQLYSITPMSPQAL